jgi:hypothetical protein
MFARPLLIRSFLSGALSYLSVLLPHFLGSHLPLSDDEVFFLPGMLFGLLILVPLARKDAYRIGRWMGLVAFSTGAWYVAVTVGFRVLPMVQPFAFLSCGVSGSMGALLLAASGRLLIPWRFDASSLAIGIFAGFLGGCIFGLALQMPRASLPGEALYLAGFLIWQSSVALSLFGRPQYGNETNRNDARG